MLVWTRPERDRAGAKDRAGELYSGIDRVQAWEIMTVRLKSGRRDEEKGRIIPNVYNTMGVTVTEYTLYASILYKYLCNKVWVCITYDWRARRSFEQWQSQTNYKPLYPVAHQK